MEFVYFDPDAFTVLPNKPQFRYKARIYINIMRSRRKRSLYKTDNTVDSVPALHTITNNYFPSNLNSTVWYLYVRGNLFQRMERKEGELPTRLSTLLETPDNRLIGFRKFSDRLPVFFFM